MNVNDKAVEAAARALYIQNSIDAKGDPAKAEQLWERIPSDAQQAWADRWVRPSVEAAAPYIQAQALRDAAEDLYSYRGRITTMEGAVTWIRDRADELEAGSD